MIRSSLHSPRLAFRAPFVLILILVCSLPARLLADGVLSRLTELARLTKKSKSKTEPTETKSKVPIDGAFGFRFGQTLPAARIAEIDEYGLAYQFLPSEPISGLYTYTVWVTPVTGKILGVTAFTTGLPEARFEQIVAAFVLKHGQTPKQAVNGVSGMSRWSWRDGKRRLVLSRTEHGTWIRWMDETLQERGELEWPQYAAKPPPPFPLGGTAAVRGVSTDGMFGAMLDAAFPPPAGAKATETGFKFDFAPRDPVPGITQFEVEVSRDDSKIQTVSCVGFGLTPEKQKELRDDLIARFGPSSLGATSGASDGSMQQRFAWSGPNGFESNDLVLLIWSDGQVKLYLTNYK